MPNSERFKLIVQGELSYAVEFDGQHMDEWSERDGAEAYIEFWSGKLTLERAEAIEECAKQLETGGCLLDISLFLGTKQKLIDAFARGMASALRSKLAAPEKEETNVLDRQ